MSNTLDAIAADLQNYVVSPLNAFGLGGFIFDAEGESIARLSADITDHYTEDNHAIQDHIAIHPKRITLKGYVGEVVYTTADQDLSLLQKAVQKLTQISEFLPSISSYAAQAEDALSSPLSSTINLGDASNIYGMVKNLISSNGDEARQQNAYLYFQSLMNQGILMGVQTPWEFITNMVIETITAVQSENSRFITDFSITLKQMRFAKTKTNAFSTIAKGTSAPNNLSPDATQGDMSQSGVYVPLPEKQLIGAAALQATNPVKLGNVPGVALPSPTLPSFQSQIDGADAYLNNPAVLKTFKRAVGQ